jgi:hypothetical protein
MNRICARVAFPYAKLFTLFLFTHTACQLNQSPNDIEIDRSSPNHTLSIPASVIAIPRVASPLVKGLFQQARSGQKLDFQISYDVDQALDALKDNLILAAFNITLATESSGLPVGQSSLWWATRNHHFEITQEQWWALLTGTNTKLPDGTPFQLCLRQEPDLLEQLWIKSRPEDRLALTQARKSGRWPIFDNDQVLLDHLSSHPGAIALFAEGNLKLKGAPLTQLKITDIKSISILISLHINQNIDRLPSVFSQLIHTLKSRHRDVAVEEWGWQK